MIHDKIKETHFLLYTLLRRRSSSGNTKLNLFKFWWAWFCLPTEEEVVKTSNLNIIAQPNLCPLKFALGSVFGGLFLSCKQAKSSQRKRIWNHSNIIEQPALEQCATIPINT
jgi:hypothetical protein